jgi:hypothetical protein
MSTISDAVDAALAVIATETSLKATRDPSRVIPPCLYAETPSVVGYTQGGVTLELVIHLVPAGNVDNIGKEWLMSKVIDFANAGKFPRVDPGSLEVDGIARTTYQGTATITVRST